MYDFTKDDLSKTKTSLETGAKQKHCKYITPKMTTLKKHLSFLPQQVINVSGGCHEETGKVGL